MAMSGDAPPHHCGNHLEDGPPADLSHAGAVIDKAIIRVLDNAIASVRAGELHHLDGSGRA